MKINFIKSLFYTILIAICSTMLSYNINGNLYADDDLEYFPEKLHFELIDCQEETVEILKIRNKLEKVLLIDSIWIDGKNASNFIIRKINTKFSLPAFTVENIRIGFRSFDNETKYAKLNISIKTQDDSAINIITINLLGERFSNLFELSDNNLDFGIVEPNQEKILTLKLKTRALNSYINQFTPIKRNNFEAFKLVKSDNPIDKEAILFVRFKGEIETDYLDTIYIKDRCGFSYPIILKASIKKKNIINLPIIQVESIACNTGDIIDLKINIKNNELLEKYSIDSIYSNLIFNATILHPIENTPIGTVHNGMRTIKLALDVGNHNTFSYKFKVALGNDSVTKLILDDTYTFPKNENINVVNSSGELKLLDLCNEGGTRLINTNNIFNSSFSLLNSDEGIIKYNLIENSFVKLLIYDYRGNPIKILRNQFMDKGYYEEIINLDFLGNGMFFVQLQTPTINNFFNINISR